MCPESINRSTVLFARKAVKPEDFFPPVPEKETLLLGFPLVVMIGANK